LDGEVVLADGVGDGAQDVHGGDVAGIALKRLAGGGVGFGQTTGVIEREDLFHA
jgi:hypothetical protein